LRQAAQLAASFDVRLALEFRSGSGWCSSVSTAAALVEACQEPNLGICFDLFHYYTGPSKPEDLQCLTKENLFHVQLCDLAGTWRELAADADRVLPGDGDFQFDFLIRRLRDMGYDGCLSVELVNPEIWKVKPAQIAEAAMMSMRRILGESMDGE
jgi:4-hydroxyphenylpyruvate dioxygenase